MEDVPGLEKGAPNGMVAAMKILKATMDHNDELQEVVYGSGGVRDTIREAYRRRSPEEEEEDNGWGDRK